MSQNPGSRAVGRRDPDRAIAVYRQAVAAAFADRCRQGCVARLPAEGDVLVTGDLHGSRVNFMRLLKVADLEHHLDRHLILQEGVHGGPTSASGGCLSFIVVEAMAALKAKYADRVHVLIGNHDVAEHIQQLIFKDGVSLNQAFEQGMAEAYGDRRHDVREWYERFVQSMLVACRTEHGLFVSHSIPEGRNVSSFDVGLFEHERISDDIRRSSSLYTLVWGRDHRQDTADRFAERVGAELLLVGHTPCPMGYEVPNNRQVILQSYDEAGCYVLLRLDRPLDQAEVAASVRRLATDRHPDDTVVIDLEELALDEIPEEPANSD